MIFVIPAVLIAFLLIPESSHVSAATNQTMLSMETNLFSNGTLSGIISSGNQQHFPVFLPHQGLDAGFTTTNHLNPLFEKAGKQGRVPVIVKLNLAFTPEGNLRTLSGILSQRQSINQTQDLLNRALSLYHADHVKKFRSIPFMAMRVDAATLKYLNSSGLVSGIYEDRLLSPLDVNTIPLTGTGNAWNLGYNGSGQTIAVLDTGVDKTHPFLSGRVVSEACYSTPVQAGDTSLCPDGQTSQTGSGSAVPCSNSISSSCFHGTFVAGIAAGNNATYLPGFAKGANIIAVQVFHEDDTTADCGSTTPCILASDSDIISGLEYVYGLRTSYNIAAVNLSLGGYEFPSSCDSTFPQYKSEFDTLQSVGIAPVVAAGNGGYVNELASPACVSSAVSVGSTNDSDQISSFSDRASFLSLMAPGESVTSSVPGGGIGTASGTSFAAPAVAGAFAILKEKNPSSSVATILSELQGTGRSISDSGSGLSFPRIETDSALQLLSCGPPSSGDWTIPSSCAIGGTATSPANVVVKSGAVLTIPAGLRLNIDFAHYHLLVKSGGGVLIKAGGSIN